jgi:hypothetical protein
LRGSWGGDRLCRCCFYIRGIANLVSGRQNHIKLQDDNNSKSARGV